MKYAILESESIKEVDQEGKEVIKEVKEEEILVSGNEQYGNVCIKDLAEHQVLIEKQMADLELADEEKYPTKKEELEQLAKDLVAEQEVANKMIKDLGFSVKFKDVVNSIRG